MSRVRKWAYEEKNVSGQNWSVERDALVDKWVSDIHKPNLKRMEKIAGHALRVLEKNISRMDMREGNVSLRDMERLTKMLGDIDKIIRLEQGRPTDIRTNVRMNHQQIMEAFHALKEVDPYSNYQLDAIESKDESKLN